MDRNASFIEGFRCASKAAVTLIHEQAAQMNDPSAKAALNMTAHRVGQALAARTYVVKTSTSPHAETTVEPVEANGR